jgi:hypothetical protein
MKFTSFALAAAVLGASFSAAQADAYWKAGDLLPIAQVQAQTTAPVVEGRQAAPVAVEPTFHLTDAERHIIEQNLPHR